MICYSDGQPVELGDIVDFDGESASVIEIIETEQQATAEGLPEPAVGFKTDNFAAVYQSPNDRGWDGVKLLLRRRS
jgi:hypothetical protein